MTTTTKDLVWNIWDERLWHWIGVALKGHFSHFLNFLFSQKASFMCFMSLYAVWWYGNSILGLIQSLQDEVSAPFTSRYITWILLKGAATISFKSCRASKNFISLGFISHYGLDIRSQQSWHHIYTTQKFLALQYNDQWAISPLCIICTLQCAALAGAKCRTLLQLVCIKHVLQPI